MEPIPSVSLSVLSTQDYGSMLTFPAYQYSFQYHLNTASKLHKPQDLYTGHPEESVKDTHTYELPPTTYGYDIEPDKTYYAIRASYKSQPYTNQLDKNVEKHDDYSSEYKSTDKLVASKDEKSAPDTEYGKLDDSYADEDKREYESFRSRNRFEPYKYHDLDEGKDVYVKPPQGSKYDRLKEMRVTYDSRKYESPTLEEYGQPEKVYKSIDEFEEAFEGYGDPEIDYKEKDLSSKSINDSKSYGKGYVEKDNSEKKPRVKEQIHGSNYKPTAHKKPVY